MGDRFKAFLGWLIFYLLGSSFIFGVLSIGSPKLFRGWIAVSMLFGVGFYGYLKGWTVPWYSGEWWGVVGETLGRRVLLLMMIAGSIFALVGATQLLQSDGTILYLALDLTGMVLLLFTFKIAAETDLGTTSED